MAMVELETVQPVIDELRAQLEYREVLCDLAEAERDEWKDRAKNLERQILRLMSDRTYLIPEVA